MIVDVQDIVEQKWCLKGLKNLDTTSANIEYEAYYKIVIDEKSREVLWQSGHAVGSLRNTERELQMFVLLITLRK